MPATVRTAAKKKMVRVERASQNDVGCCVTGDGGDDGHSSSPPPLAGLGLRIVVCFGGADLDLGAFVEAVGAAGDDHVGRARGRW